MTSKFKKFVLPIIVLTILWILFATVLSPILNAIIFTLTLILSMSYVLWLILSHVEQIENWFNRDGWK